MHTRQAGLKLQPQARDPLDRCSFMFRGQVGVFGQHLQGGARCIWFRHDYFPTANFDDYALRVPSSSVTRGDAPHDVQPSLAAPTQAVRGTNWCECDTSQRVEYETQSAGATVTLGVIGYTDEI